MATPNPSSQLDAVIVPRSRDLGDNFEVRRALPAAERRMVGPFVFFDRFGPTILAKGHGLDVRPHPHIGLATVTYLFEGEIVHRDSVGSIQAIRAGDVNWMTAGAGIVHSERTAPEQRLQPSALAGLQLWVGLPVGKEEVPPAFEHISVDRLPVEEGEGTFARIIAGRFFGHTSPVPTLSDLFYVDVQLQPGRQLCVPADYEEQAVYVAEGEIELGQDGRFGRDQLLVLKPRTPVTLTARGSVPARLMLLGGEPIGPRHVVWNFVSSSRERIEQAKEDWRQRRFPDVPGETEFIPLPKSMSQPVDYP